VLDPLDRESAHLLEGGSLRYRTAAEKAGRETGISGLPGPTKVNSRPPKIAEFLNFSGPIREQRPSSLSWCWRSDRSCRQNPLRRDFNGLRNTQIEVDVAGRIMSLFSADGRLAGATLLSEVGACGRRKLESGTRPAHQSPRLRGRRASGFVRSPRRDRRCHGRPASLPDASAGAELGICAGTAGSSPGSPLRRGSPGRRSDHRGTASGREGVKAGKAPGAAGPGLDARASRCGTVIIGSMPRPDQLRPRRRPAHPAPVASGSRCRPAISGA
jgi:hypothetical protein